MKRCTLRPEESLLEGETVDARRSAERPQFAARESVRQRGTRSRPQGRIGSLIATDEAQRSLVPWASRAAGGIGIVTAVLYLAILLGEEDASQIPEAIIWFSVMAGTGAMAWFADRAAPATGRRMMWVAFGVFMALGVLAIFSIGVLYLVASLLAIYSLGGGGRSARLEETGSGR